MKKKQLQQVRPMAEFTTEIPTWLQKEYQENASLDSLKLCFDSIEIDFFKDSDSQGTILVNHLLSCTFDKTQGILRLRRYSSDPFQQIRTIGDFVNFFYEQVFYQQICEGDIFDEERKRYIGFELQWSTPFYEKFQIFMQDNIKRGHYTSFYSLFE